MSVGTIWCTTCIAGTKRCGGPGGKQGTQGGMHMGAELHGVVVVDPYAQGTQGGAHGCGLQVMVAGRGSQSYAEAHGEGESDVQLEPEHGDGAGGQELTLLSHSDVPDETTG